MELDFYRHYEDLPLPELVKIARTPSEYMPDAVKAAERILKERGITQEEIAAEEWAIAQKEMADGLRRNSRRDYAGWIGEIFGKDVLTNPSHRWFTILLVLYGLYYTYYTYAVISQLVWLSRCMQCPPYSSALLASNLVFESYITLCLYCILKQRWLGWSLILIHAAFFIGREFSFLFHAYVHHNIYFERACILALPALTYIAFGLILWRPALLATFKIDQKIKSRTLLVAALAVIAGMMVA
jgi:hypothetical protein